MRDAIAVRPDRAGEHQHEAGCAVLQLMARFGIGDGRIGMVHALQDLPGRRRRRAASGREPACGA